jgi:hypothetical protein
MTTENLIELLHKLDEDGDNEDPHALEAQSNWSTHELKQAFDKVSDDFSFVLDQCGTGDAFFWGNVIVHRRVHVDVVAAITLSKFGRLAYLNVCQDLEASEQLRLCLDAALVSLHATLVPEHVAMTAKNPHSSSDTWFSRFFDYV